MQNSTVIGVGSNYGRTLEAQLLFTVISLSLCLSDMRTHIVDFSCSRSTQKCILIPTCCCSKFLRKSDIMKFAERTRQRLVYDFMEEADYT